MRRRDILALVGSATLLRGIGLQLHSAKRSIGGASALGLLGWNAAAAQTSRKPFRIGYLRFGQPGDASFVAGSWRDELLRLGYVEDRDFVVEERFAEGSNERAVALARELASLNVDVIVAQSTPSAHAAKQATTTIPIVAAAADPVGTGLVASLARPGANVTGVSLNLVEPAAKRLQLLKEAMTGLSRVGYLASARDPAASLFVEQVRVASARLGLELHSIFIGGPAEFDGAFAAMREARVGAVMVQPLFTAQRAALLAAASKHRLAVASDFRAFAEAGALMSYGFDGNESVRRMAAFVDRILKGAKPADLPMEEPRKFELVVNLKTAKALGITIPESLLAHADEVIE